MYHKFDYKL